jgi:hypothetical protein
MKRAIATVAMVLVSTLPLACGQQANSGAPQNQTAPVATTVPPPPAVSLPRLPPSLPFLSFPFLGTQGLLGCFSCASRATILRRRGILSVALWLFSIDSLFSELDNNPVLFALNLIPF